MGHLNRKQDTKNMIIEITVKPNSKKGPLIEPRADGSLVLYVREIPIENKVNNNIIKLIAGHFKISKSNVTILRGHKSRKKIIEIKE